MPGLVRGDGNGEGLLDGGHGGIGDAAVVYEGEVVEVRGEVEGQAVHGYPALHVDANGGDFILGNPDTGLSVSPGPGNAKACECADQDFFQLPEMLSQVCAVPSEVQNGVPDDLARPVVGDVSAAVGVDEPDASFGEVGLGDQDVIEVSGAAEGDDGGVFEEDEGIGDTAGDAAIPEFGL